MNGGAWVTASAVVLYLIGLEVGARRAEWITKPLAATGFVVSALQHGALGSAYGVCVLVALCLSWCGDVLLIPRTKGTFLAGLGAFLFAHVAYAAAFVIRGVAIVPACVSALAVAAGVYFVARWLLPHVKGFMKKAVLAYMAAIGAMVTLAAGTFFARADLLVLIGAVAFFVSDISVARDRFVKPGVANKRWGAPLYFGAQLLFAASVP
jgi:uncharacterized membrane protein YhhN